MDGDERERGGSDEMDGWASRHGLSRSAASGSDSFGFDIVVVFVGARLDVELELGFLVVFRRQRLCPGLRYWAVRCIVKFPLSRLFWHTNLNMAKAGLDFRSVVAAR